MMKHSFLSVLTKEGIQRLVSQFLQTLLKTLFSDFSRISTAVAWLYLLEFLMSNFRLKSVTVVEWKRQKPTLIPTSAKTAGKLFLCIFGSSLLQPLIWHSWWLRGRQIDGTRVWEMERCSISVLRTATSSHICHARLNGMKYLRQCQPTATTFSSWNSSLCLRDMNLYVKLVCPQAIKNPLQMFRG